MFLYMFQNIKQLYEQKKRVTVGGRWVGGFSIYFSEVGSKSPPFPQTPFVALGFFAVELFCRGSVHRQKKT